MIAQDRLRGAPRASLRVAIVAAEASGDALGAGLIDALRRRVPAAQFFGMAGRRMISSGCDAWYGTDEVSVMGFSEVLPHLGRILRLRRELIRRIESAAPDVFIGIDSPDFNLPIEARLKASGIPAVQYVSPQVWAWRHSRVASIRRATDLVLCVLPVESDFYAEHNVPARFVGHPLADAIPLEVDPGASRQRLGIDENAKVVALLPGSRHSEVSRLAAPFIATAVWLAERRPDLTFAIAAANDGVARLIDATVTRVGRDVPFVTFTGRAREVLGAASAVLTASGTATLEALLCKRPMVVAHKLAPLTYWLARRLGVSRMPNFSLPNILSGRAVVPEFIQGQVRPSVLGPALSAVLDGRGLHEDWYHLFSSIHRQLRRDANSSAAAAILDLLWEGSKTK
jgi:lipid-A-disaccharide synthase